MNKLTRRSQPRQALSQKEPATFEFWRSATLPAVFLHEAAKHKLNITDILLYAVIDALGGDGPGCHSSNDYLARSLDLTKNWVSISVSKLERMGYLRIKLFQLGKKVTYHVGEKACHGTCYRTIWTLKDLGKGWDDPCEPHSHPPCEPHSHHDNTVNSKKQTPTPLPLRGSGDRAGGKMPKKLIANLPNGQTSHIAAISQRAFRFADTLHDAIVAAGFVQRYSHTQWAKEMEKLLQSAGAERTRNALLWFIDNIKDQYTPQVRSARKFRLRIKDIEAAAERHQERNPVVQVTQKARNIAKDLCNYHDWPMGSKDQLPAAVQRSMDNVEAFRNKIEEFRIKHNKGEGRSSKIGGKGHTRFGREDTLAAFAGRLLEETRTTESFFTVWFEQTYESVKGWKQWSGKVPVLEIAKDRFQKLGLAWAQQYSSDPTLWKDLMKELGYESRTTRRVDGEASANRDGS